jgi:hypothetical protein
VAVRIEFFTIDGTGDFELVPAADLSGAVAAYDAGASAAGEAIRCVGWLEASDDEEARFSGWCDALDDDLGVGLLRQGLGEDARLSVDHLAAATEEPEARWASTIRTALEAAAGGRLGWRTDFDEV